MKRILLLSLLLLPIVALAQYPTFSNKQKLGVQTTGDGLIFRGNSNPNYNPSNINNAYFYLDTTTSKLYLYSVGTWQQVYPTASDTLSLGAYLLKSDTLSMLLPYLRKSDTISLSNRINLKLNISDTTILSNRITTNANNIITINNKLATKLDTIYTKFKDVVTMIENKDTINIGSSLTDGYGINIIGDSVNIDTSIIFTQSDTITLSNRIDTKLNVSDTVSLSNRIDLKLNKTDTINLSDRIDLKLNKSDTISLSNRIDIKLNASDTVSLSNRINKKLDTLYVNYPTYIDTITNKDTIQIAPSLVLTEGFGINIIGDSINIDSAVILETQQKQIAYVKNQSGVTMYKGQAVYSSGSSGSNKLVQLASSNTEQASSKTFGIVETDSIPNGGHGYVITFGVLSGFNTNALTEGFTVYLSSTPGQLTSVKPIAPLHMVTIGICIRQQQNNGSIFVKIQNGFEFDELHDVRITTPVDKASIYYNLSENLWRDTTAALLVSDTISMLNPYLRKLDTISLSNRIDLRVKYADTTNMLLPYFRTNDTTLLNLNSRLSIKLNLSDTANMLSKYVNTYSNQIDINGNKTFNNVVTIDSATVTGKLLVNTNISDAVKINSNTNSTNLELANNSGNSVFIKSSNRNMTLQTDTTALIYLNGETNRVGILTMTPEQALEVNGTIRVDSLSNNLTPVKIIGANSSNDLTNLEIGNGLFISNDTLRVADNIINSGDTATLLRQDFLGINTNVLTWQQGSKKLLQYFTQVYRNGQLLKSDSQYTITSDSIVTLEEGSYRLGDNITIIAIDNIVALAGSGSMITLQGDVTGSGTNTITTTIGVGKVTNSMLAGSISDSKLNTITTVGKVSNSATTATNNSTGNTIVSRDASGNFSAGTITASLNGNANTVTTNANLTGDVTSTGNATSIATGVIVNADINASAAIAVSKLAASTISGVTLGNNLNTLTISSPLTGTSYNGSSAVSIGIPVATGSVNGYLSSTDWTTFNNKQSQLNGTGFVKASGTSITYDNSSYLPLTGGTLTGGLAGTTATFNTRLGVGSIENPSVTSLFTSGSGNQEIHFTHSDNIPGRKVSLRLTNNNSGFYTYGGLIYALQGEGLNQYTRMTLGVNTNEIMHLTRFSRVGILNDAPSYTLDVNGTFNANGNSLIGGTLGVTGAATISNTLSTTSYAALDAGNNTHRLTNTLSGNQTWTPSAGFLTSYFNNNVSGGWYYNTSVDNSGFPILSILSTSNDRKKAGITLNSQGTANGTYSPAITFSSLSNSTSYYSAYAAIIGKKTGVGGASGSDANWNTGHIEFYGTTQATDVNGGVMLNSPSMTLGLGVGIGYDAPPTIKGRLLVSERIGVATNDPTNTVDINGTLRVRTTNTITSTALLGRDDTGVVGGITIGNSLNLSSGTLNVSSKITDINTSQYTISPTDLYIDNFNNSSTTIILPLAGLNTYRELKFKNSSNGALIANGNIVPLSGSGTTTTILPATNAKWCTLVSDGAFWRIMQSN